MHEPLLAVAAEASTCTRCELAKARTQVVFGVGDADAGLMIVGEAPGAEEDRLGEPFVGRSGQLVDRMLAEELGVTRDRVYIANIVKCRPPGNRDPRPEEVAACRPWLAAQFDRVAPRVVLTLGNVAARTLLGTKEGVTRLRGRTHPYGAGVLVSTLHPAYVLRNGATLMGQMRADFVRAKLALAAS